MYNDPGSVTVDVGLTFLVLSFNKHLSDKSLMLSNLQKLNHVKNIREVRRANRPISIY